MSLKKRTNEEEENGTSFLLPEDTNLTEIDKDLKSSGCSESAEDVSVKSPKESNLPVTKHPKSAMQRLFGFELSDLSSWNKFVCLLNRPSDPSSLAVLRICFGVMMTIDMMEERGLGHVDYLWGDPEECRFPLFDFLQPLHLKWMCVLYLLLLIGTVGIALGLFFRVSSFIFIVCYWFFFLLDKTRWNNHSYLFGLSGILLFFTDSHHAWSLDSLRRSDIKHSHIPLWNYTLFRAQFFLVYFIAGLKKLDADWVGGYSMRSLSAHWVFKPFSLVMTPEQIDLFVVHHGGLLIDLFIGYALFFDVTRTVAMYIAGSFHLMNSQIFSIGMFPWTMLATMPIFCNADWPKVEFNKPSVCQKHNHCLYPKDEVKPDESVADEPHDDIVKEPSSRRIHSQPGRRHQMAAVFCILYLSLQCFLPYSHFVTKGYNNWTNGLYGYSWDMMIHSWSVQHLRITYVDRDTGKTGYLNPGAWTHDRYRWASHADMTKQYARCIKDRLVAFNITNVELYFDVWRSLNDRFQQRMFDPRVNVLEAEWSAFRSTPWALPLLTDLSDWRNKLDEIEKGVYGSSNVTDVTFIADFPGLTLENYIQEELNDTHITVLNGAIDLELVDAGTVTRYNAGDKTMVPAGQFHKIHTVSDTPSCLMYIFRNTTEEELSANVTLYEQQLLKNNTDDSVPVDQKVKSAYEYILATRNLAQEQSNTTYIQRVSKYWNNKRLVYVKGFTMLYIALVSIVTQQPFEIAFNDTMGPDFIDFDISE